MVLWKKGNGRLVGVGWGSFLPGPQAAGATAGDGPSVPGSHLLLHDSRSQAGGAGHDETYTFVPLAAVFLIFNGEPSILTCQFLVGENPITSGRWRST